MSDPPRSYTREEMRRLLEAATSTHRHAPDAPGEAERYTLAEIREIAAEAGIDPDRVDRAARSLAHDTGIESALGMGTYQAERVIPGALTIDDLREAAGECDRFFGVQGEIRRSRRHVEWYARSARAFVGLVAQRDHCRARVVLDRAPGFLGGQVGIGLVAGAALVSVASEAGGPLAVVLCVGVVLLGIALVVGFRIWLRDAAVARCNRLLDLLEHEVALRRAPE